VILAGMPGTFGAFAVQATTGNVLGVITKMQQRVQGRVSDDKDISAAATVAT
jgi:hypothetical protein